ncbi:hypothetical protein CHCC20335_3024 [Bacillus paralicheniformis]|nr:hypothetical protein CHCC20335_3024 [Bacillus paralicheniformis]
MLSCQLCRHLILESSKTWGGTFFQKLSFEFYFFLLLFTCFL